MPAEDIFIGIGSNIGDSQTIVCEAMDGLANLPDSELLEQSKLYRSEAVSDIPQDDYINAVAKITTRLQPFGLLMELQALEGAFYRQRDPALKWAPRSLDLDIILFGSRNINDSHLTVPHAQMQNRLFVLLPLFEICGDRYIPGLGSLQYLIDQAPDIDIKPL